MNPEKEPKKPRIFCQNTSINMATEAVSIPELTAPESVKTGSVVVDVTPIDITTEDSAVALEEVSLEAKPLAELLEHPDDEELLSRLNELLLKGGSDLDNAAHQIKNWLEPEVSELMAFGFGATTWSNCIQQQQCHPSKVLKVSSLEGIKAAITEAKKQPEPTLRAVGSGHSFSNVAPVFEKGLLVDPHPMNKVLSLDMTILKETKAKLFSVQSGITIKDLNQALDKAGLALINMGAYDGQTISGAISTGTHGTGVTLGPIASCVRAIVLVVDSDKVYQVEPSNGISDPQQFKENVKDRTLVQDDEWFRTVLISMGCTGIIYSYILEVMDSYYLKETRTMDSWENVKSRLTFPADGSLPTELTKYRHYEVDINPYPVNSAHACIVQRKEIVDANKRSGARGWSNWIAGLVAGSRIFEAAVVGILNRWPRSSPWAIHKALTALVGNGYIDKSYNVLTNGPVENVKAMAVELSYPLDKNLVKSIDELLSILQDEASKQTWYMAGPIAVRFVAASDAYLAPQQGRPTCMVELDMLVGINSGNALLKAVVKRVQDQNQDVRVHWGLDLDTVDEHSVRNRYSEFPKWQSVYEKLNVTGLFNSPLTKRLGISVKR